MGEHVRGQLRGPSGEPSRGGGSRRLPRVFPRHSGRTRYLQGFVSFSGQPVSGPVTVR
ncbi:hypothetical protein APASM_5378 [Actinosynnema pretiosum subsp. pretiosum]|nr:hypothetical protein APASM_5378 [Actinosynnema pretiosum subsp. pretiosum]